MDITLFVYLKIGFIFKFHSLVSDIIYGRLIWVSQYHLSANRNGFSKATVRQNLKAAHIVN